MDDWMNKHLQKKLIEKIKYMSVFLEIMNFGFV